ncbi:MAG: hypothetical protein IJC89_00055 [Clostridia bacterium]|nr:hypothetical protein [Clostridia bacterium]
MVDFHTHILPGIDDGSQNTDISIKMLALAAKQGITTLLATPHFNIERISIEDFLNRRQQALNLLNTAVLKENISSPKIILGAEVFLTHGLSANPDLKKLCIDGTNAILLELPTREWSEWIYHEIYRICTFDIIPVIAHTERYFGVKANRKNVLRLLDMDICVQINSGNIGRFGYIKAVNILFNSHKPIVLGSDTHNITSRKSEFDKGIRKIEKYYGKEVIYEILNSSNELLNKNFSF